MQIYYEFIVHIYKVKLELWVIGKTSFDFVDSGVSEFEKRLSRFTKFETNILIPTKKGDSNYEVQVKNEASFVLAKLQPSDMLILLDENGTELNSRKFARWLQDKFHQQSKRIIFLVGGAFGFHSSLYKRANHQLALSKMTFSHQLIRLIFAEQLYRAFTIIHNHPYHND